MIYTEKIERAIRFALKTHEVYQKQKRKGKDIPYITHPLTVGLILSQAGATEDVVIAGLLHDTMEDSTEEKRVTKTMLIERFGENVAELVESVTETNKALSWEERKAEAIEHINTFSHDSVLLKSADVIANGREIADDVRREGDATFERFNASKENILSHSLRVMERLISRWPESPLAQDLENLMRKFASMQSSSMSAHPAAIIEFDDYNENMALECPNCGWKGTPKESQNINTDSHFAMDVSCPHCDKMLLVVQYPQIK